MAATAAEPDAKKRRLGWLRPPEMSPDGSMALVDHLREIRYRVTVSAIFVVLASIGAAFFYRQLVEFILWPYYMAKEQVLETNPGAQFLLTNDGVIAPFTLAVIASIMAGLMISSPFWLYQLWAFVAPGLVAKEKKYALGFIGSAAPLFLLGCAIGYWVWPKGIAVMLSFTPKDMDITNLLEMTKFLSLEIKLILVFGASFLLPVVLVALNLAGVVRAHHLAKSRRIVIFAVFVFAAVATPSTDPFSMLALALPMVILYFVAELICRVLDKKRGITAESVAEFAIDVDDGK